jgi:ATP-dependent helicase/nuclease subunit A
MLTIATTRRFTSATAIKAAASEEANEKPETSDDTEPWAKGRGGTRLGRAVHAAIQSLPLDADDATIAAFASAQAVAEAIPHREAEVLRLVTWVVRESGAWQRALGADRAMREVPFALEMGGVVLEGFIDLVLQGPDGVEIVDWKTDVIDPDAIPARIAEYGYETQAGLYVHGLQEATGLTVSRVTYVFASAKVEHAFESPSALATQARDSLLVG